MSCMNTQMMNRRQYDEDMAERREYAAEDRAIELMGAGEECDPCGGYNLAEALDEADHKTKEILGNLIREGKFGDAGIFLRGISQTYWASKANEQAWDELT